MKIEPYLHFAGRCEEATEFYRDALGAQVTTLFHLKNVPMEKRAHVPGADQMSDDAVIYAQLQIGESTLHLTDAPLEGQSGFDGFSLSLFAPDEIEARRLFAALADGGKIQTPLGATFFSPCFGLVRDRFGLNWRLSAAP